MKIIKNIINLGFVQVANFLIPILLIPILISAFGVEGYGLIAFIQLCGYFVFVFVDYGFSLGAVQKILSEDPRNRAEIINSILYLQLFVFIAISVPLYFLFDAISGGLYQGYAVYVIFYSFSYIINSAWLYQSTDSLGLYARFQVLIKVIYILLAYVFVSMDVSIKFILILYILISITFGISLFFHTYLKNNFSHKNALNFALMKILLLNNFGFFISKLSILSYTSFLSILIGIFYGPYTLGVYSIADKIRGAMQAFLIPISQVMLPEITNQVRLRNFNYIYKSIKLSLIFSLLTALLIYMVFSFFIIDILTFLNAEISQQQIFLCKILGLIIFPVTISNWAGKQILIPFGHSKYFNNILLSISVFTMLMIIPIISNFDVEYVSLLYLGSEMLVGIAMTFIIYFRRVLHNEQ